MIWDAAVEHYARSRVHGADLTRARTAQGSTTDPGSLLHQRHQDDDDERDHRDDANEEEHRPTATGLPVVPTRHAEG